MQTSLMKVGQSLVLALGMLACAGGAGQHPATLCTEAVAARPDDVASVEGIMRAFYEVVNVAPDAPRQWGRDRTLYSPWIRFVATGKSPSGRPEVVSWTQQQLVDATEPLIREGFREREIHRVERRYGHIVHIDSTYETFIGLETPKRSRGVNSIELYFDGTRWWIASVMWQSEDAEHPIPTELLPPAGG
jgi:hypothetical protein